MMSTILGRVTRRTPCRDGHTWTSMAYPEACSICGRARSSTKSAA